MPPPYLYHHGQDATFHIPQTAFHYPTLYYDSLINGEELDIASTSGDDEFDGLDCNAHLRSQQLNSDGTPKRPMNAFMIFARKRRPMEEKQFYLDQAKKLKDQFNMRWPDYVYRRRPNNSRKRRKLGGQSGVGPVRNGEASPDGRVGTPAESTGANHSGDESQSSVSSPLSTQSKLLYPAADINHGGSPGQISERSPRLPVASLGFGVGAAYNITTNAKILGNGTPLDHPDVQRDFYRGSHGAYYGQLDHETTFGDTHPAGIESQIPNWNVFDDVPSGAVATFSPSPPPNDAAPSHLAQPNLSNQVYPLGDWAKPRPGPDFEDGTKLWGDQPSLGDHHGVDGHHGMHTLLPSEDSTLGLSPLGFRSEGSPSSTMPTTHPYGSNEASLIDGGHYQPAYIDASQPSHGSRSSSSASPYQRNLPALHPGPASPFINANHWAPSTHPN
ncbi:hypothetical protein FRC07_010586 [Ceratobasidium sp. 392]|nr:hypothetical protein FRC07_010586 [Ceratobasidium sp. 392]